MAAFEARIAQLAGKPLVWALLIGVLFGLPLLRGLRAGQPPTAPPVLGRFPAFTLRDDQGGAFSDGDLRGRAFIANLICARCGAAGAAAAERMRSLQYRTRNLGERLLLVSFSAEPEPAARRQGRRPSFRWRIAAGIPEEAQSVFPGEGALVLVDAQLRIRGRYPPDALESLLRDAALVVSMN